MCGCRPLPRLTGLSLGRSWSTASTASDYAVVKIEPKRVASRTDWAHGSSCVEPRTLLTMYTPRLHCRGHISCSSMSCCPYLSLTTPTELSFIIRRGLGIRLEVSWQCRGSRTQGRGHVHGVASGGAGRMSETARGAGLKVVRCSYKFWDASGDRHAPSSHPVPSTVSSRSRLHHGRRAEWS